MLRKLVYVLPVAVVAAIVFTGCVPPTVATATTPQRSVVNTIKYAEQTTPMVITTPTLVDLEVASSKVSGSATDKYSTSMPKSRVTARLEQIAIASALQQREGADVLVAVVFYYEDKRSGQSSGEMTVTAIGYPARYRNFRPYKPDGDNAIPAVLNNEAPQIIINDPVLQPAPVPQDSVQVQPANQ